MRNIKDISIIKVLKMYCFRSLSITKSHLGCLFILFILIWLISSGLYMTSLLFPEIEMVLSSQCKYPIKSWDGKILNIPIWKNGLAGRSANFNVNSNNEEYASDRRKLRSLSNSNDIVNNNNNKYSKQPVIFWGSHHKTGTYLAQKMFSLLCAKMSWCCVFHVTRDSIHSVRESIDVENAHVIGHSQWIWYPEEFGVFLIKLYLFYYNIINV